MCTVGIGTEQKEAGRVSEACIGIERDVVLRSGQEGDIRGTSLIPLRTVGEGIMDARSKKQSCRTSPNGRSSGMAKIRCMEARTSTT